MDLSLLTNLLSFFGVLLFLVVAHELGHFVTAKMAGVQVHEFGIGFPPKVFGFKYGETEYTINALPLGGFVRMEGEEDPSNPRSLAAASIPWRIVILAAGVTVNAVLAFILFGVSAALPHNERFEQVVVNSVRDGSPAQSAGLQPNDIITVVNGKTINNSGDLRYQFNLNLGSPVEFSYLRNGQTQNAFITPRLAPPPGEGATGIEIGSDNSVWRAVTAKNMNADQLATAAGVNTDVAKSWITFGPEAIGITQPETEAAKAAGMTTEAYRDQQLTKVAGILGLSRDELTRSYTQVRQVSLSPAEAVPAGIRRGWEMLILTKNDMVSMVAKRTAPAVAGPVGIFQLTGQVTEQAQKDGLSVLLDLAALLSINLAVLNILPIPMLDGGRILFVLIEAVRGGRRINPEKEKFAHLIGAACLFTLIIAVTFQDILRLASGEAIFR